jgi:hypothetical protein
MLEFFLLRSVTRSLAATCREKNRSTGWAALFPVLWILGEICGAVYMASARNTSEGAIYGGALGAAVVGGIIGFVAVKALSALPPPGFPVAQAQYRQGP